MLIITIFITVFTTVILYRILMEQFVKSKVFDDKDKLLFGKAKEVKSKDYVKLGKIPTIISLTIITVGIIFAVVRGFNLGVDFTGGTNINISSTNDIDFNKVTELVKKYDVRDYDYYMGTKKEGFIKLNDILDDAVDKVDAIIKAEKCRVDRIEEVFLDTKEEEIHELLMMEDKEFINKSISEKIN